MKEPTYVMKINLQITMYDVESDAIEKNQTKVAIQSYVSMSMP